MTYRYVTRYHLARQGREAIFTFESATTELEYDPESTPTFGRRHPRQLLKPCPKPHLQAWNTIAFEHPFKDKVLKKVRKRGSERGPRTGPWTCRSQRLIVVFEDFYFSFFRTLQIHNLNCRVYKAMSTPLRTLRKNQLFSGRTNGRTDIS